jgi:RNA polymerase sigma-70 factor (ECF subfamily)
MDKDAIDLLLKRMAEANDQRAFRSLHDAYYNRLLKLAIYYLGSRVAAQEVVSNVFLGIWNNRKKLSGISRIEAYFFSSVKYKSLNYLRDNSKAEFISLDAEEVAIKPMLKNPQGDLLSNELREKIVAIIEKLPPRCKLVFELVKDNGLKYKEVADLLDISVKAVEAQVSKAMLTIRQEIYPYLSDADFERYEALRKKGFFTGLLFFM